MGSHCAQNSSGTTDAQVIANSGFMTPTYCVNCNNGDADDGNSSPYGCKSGITNDLSEPEGVNQSILPYHG